MLFWRWWQPWVRASIRNVFKQSLMSHINVDLTGLGTAISQRKSQCIWVSHTRQVHQCSDRSLKSDPARSFTDLWEVKADNLSQVLMLVNHITDLLHHRLVELSHLAHLKVTLKKKDWNSCFTSNWLPDAQEHVINCHDITEDLGDWLISLMGVSCNTQNYFTSTTPIMMERNKAMSRGKSTAICRLFTNLHTYPANNYQLTIIS